MYKYKVRKIKVLAWKPTLDLLFVLSLNLDMLEMCSKTT